VVHGLTPLLPVTVGTPVSYATSERDNELALTDCNGFVVYVAGQDHVTDVGVADGAWHHVAVTWTNQEGAWDIYKDGRRLDGGRGLAAGRHVAGSIARDHNVFLSFAHVHDRIRTSDTIHGCSVLLSSHI